MYDATLWSDVKCYLTDGVLDHSPVVLLPPSTLQYQVTVGVALSIAILSQHLPLIQLLWTSTAYTHIVHVLTPNKSLLLVCFLPVWYPHDGFFVLPLVKLLQAAIKPYDSAVVQQTFGCFWLFTVVDPKWFFASTNPRISLQICWLSGVDRYSGRIYFIVYNNITLKKHFLESSSWHFGVFLRATAYML